MKPTVKTRPKFKSEDEERDFWATHSPSDHFQSSATTPHSEHEDCH